jgi:nitrogen fixation protein
MLALAEVSSIRTAALEEEWGGKIEGSSRGWSSYLTKLPYGARKPKG